jgi:N-methylhydantoinase A
VSVRVAVDVGGTFTDLVAYEEDSGALQVEKVLTTPGNRTDGIMQALAAVPVEDVSDFIHGTTAATNAVIERTTAPTALLTTSGFRDILELMRGDRPLPVYDLSWRKPDPLIPRDLRFEVDERLDAQGEVVRPLDDEQVRELVRTPAFDGVDAVAVSFLHSFVDDRHERRAAEIIAEERPELFVSVSSDIDPEVREYERSSTVALDAMLKPLISTYLRSLEQSLREVGIGSDVYVMLANGGVMPLAGAEDRPVFAVHSGPAGGVVGATLLGGELGRRKLIGADMGGTSFDVCTIVDGAPRFRSQGTIAWGLPFRVPLVDVGTIGAGGGSIGWVDPGGLLRCGPQSAGAAPGPACYGLGGNAPTVTDACSVLGYFGEGELAGGVIRLQRESAHEAIEGLARRLGRSVEYVADGIVQIALANMAGEIRKNSVERGDDPREFSLLSFGGAGSMFASVLARSLGMREVIVPPHAGVFSAYGMLGADLRYDVQRTFYAQLEGMSRTELARAFAELERSAVERVGGGHEELSLSRELALRYAGQRHELRVPLEGGEVTEVALAHARDEFDRLHGANYGQARPGDAVELRALAVVATIARPRPALRNAGNARPEDTVKERRRVRFTGEPEACDALVYERARLATGAVVTGPAVLESPDATVVIHTGQRGTVDRTGSVLVEV